MKIQSIPIEKIKPNPNRIRKEMANKTHRLENLARSILEGRGLEQPILVKEIDVENYLIIEGERRFEACIYIRAKTIDCIILESGKNSQLIALIGNLNRKDLTEVEKADALFKIRTECEFRSNLSLARTLGISESYVRKLLAIHNLPEDAKKEINAKTKKVHEALEDSKKKSKFNNKKPLKEITIAVNTLKHLNLTATQQATLFSNIKDNEQIDKLKKILNE